MYTTLKKSMPCCCGDHVADVAGKMVRVWVQCARCKRIEEFELVVPQ